MHVGVEGVCFIQFGLGRFGLVQFISVQFRTVQLNSAQFIFQFNAVIVQRLVCGILFTHCVCNPKEKTKS